MLILLKTADSGGTDARTDGDDDGPRSGNGAGGGGGGKMLPLGSFRELLDVLGTYNIGPDGSGPQGWGDVLGMAVLYGPGMLVEIPTAAGEGRVLQLMVTLTDDDFAWPVLARLCKAQGWRMMDPDSGRSFG